jgi:hypothetical protein
MPAIPTRRCLSRRTSSPISARCAVRNSARLKSPQQVRDYAAKLAEKEQRMAEMSAKFRALGAEVYLAKERGA